MSNNDTDLIDALRQAVADNEKWSSYTSLAVVANAARSLVQAIDMRAEVIAYYRQNCTPTEQAILEILGDIKPVTLA